MRKFDLSGGLLHRTGRGTQSCAVLAVALVFSIAVGPAAAHRPPTAAEAASISRVLHSSKATSQAACFHVRGILVSTVGPWAKAKLVPCDPLRGDVALAVLQHRAGRWRIRDLGTSGTGCTVAPRRVRTDLALVCP